ncbi:MAG: hypothetical protein LC808_23810 [Actinobacteria bacterium]|nr:hypothetical protein [Actinomycetota bacterium]
MRQRIAFGGGSDQPDEAPTGAPWKLTLTCPRQGTPFEGSVLVPAHYDESVSRIEVEAITDAPLSGPPPRTAYAVGPSAADWVDEELQEWRKNTVATQRAFATTMLTTSSGGVAIYFAVLKYLGWEQANFSAPLVVLTVLPPALFLLAAMAFALALRPSVSYVDRHEYAEFRAKRIGEIHGRVTAGTVLYLAALLFAIAVFLAILEAVS